MHIYNDNTPVVLERSTTQAVTNFVRTITKIMYEHYGKSMCTASKLEKIKETKLWSQRADELEKFLDQAADQQGRREFQNKFDETLQERR